MDIHAGDLLTKRRAVAHYSSILPPEEDSMPGISRCLVPLEQGLALPSLASLVRLAPLFPPTPRLRRQR